MLRSIQEEARKILTHEDIHYLTRIQNISDVGKNYKLQSVHLEKEIECKVGYKKKTYQNYLDHVIFKGEYMSYAKEYEEDIQSLKEKLEHLKE